MQCGLFQGPHSSGSQQASSLSGAPNISAGQNLDIMGGSARDRMVEAGMPVEMECFGSSAGGVLHTGAQVLQPQHQYQGMVVQQACTRESCCEVQPGQGQMYMQVRRGPGAELPRPVWRVEHSQMIMVNNCQQPEGYQHGHHRRQQQQQMIIMHQHVSQQLGNPSGNQQSGLQDSHQVYGYYQHGRQQMMYGHGMPTRHNYQSVPPQHGHLQRQQGQIAYEHGMQDGQGSNLPGMGYRPMETMFVPTQQYVPQRSVGMAQEKQGVTGQVQGLASMPRPRPPPAAAAASLGGGGMGAPMFGGGVMYMGVPPNPGITQWPVALRPFRDVAKEMWQRPSQCSIEPIVASPGGPARVYHMGHPVEVPFGSYCGCASGAPETATGAVQAVAGDEAEVVAEEAQVQAEQMNPRSPCLDEDTALRPGEAAAGGKPKGVGEVNPGAGEELPEFISRVEGGGGSPQCSFGSCGLSGGGPQGSYEGGQRQSFIGHDYSSPCDRSKWRGDVGAFRQQYEWQGGSGKYVLCEQQFLPLHAPLIEPLKRTVGEWVTERKPRKQKWVPVPRRRRNRAERENESRPGDSERDLGVGVSGSRDSPRHTGVAESKRNSEPPREGSERDLEVAFKEAFNDFMMNGKTREIALEQEITPVKEDAIGNQTGNSGLVH